MKIIVKIIENENEEKKHEGFNSYINPDCDHNLLVCPCVEDQRAKERKANRKISCCDNEMHDEINRFFQ